MSVGSVVFKIIDLLFAGAELVSRALDKRKPPPAGLTLRDLIDMKRQDDDRVRRSQAPTVVIDPPSERAKPPPLKRR